MSSCGRYSSASSSDQYSFTSTCSGRSVDASHGADALDVEPVAAAELQLQAAEAPVARVLSARRAMSSGSPSQIVHDVGGPPRRRPSSLWHGQTEQLSLEVVQRSVDRVARGELLARQPVEDLVERERVVAERVAVRLDVRERRLCRLSS